MTVEAAQKITMGHLQRHINALPLLPTVVTELMQLNPNTDDYFERVVSLAQGEPAFATRLLMYANSASIAPRQPITTLSEAFMRVGAKGAVDLIIAHSAAQVLPARRKWESELWAHALAVATLMRSLAPRAREKIDGDKAYLFGLLHDIGRFVLYLESSDGTITEDEPAWGSSPTLINAEKAMCGFSHEELGYLALSKWGLPRELALAVRHHHSMADPKDVAPGDRPLVRLLQDADGIAILLALHADRWQTLSEEEISVALTPQLRTPFKQSTEDLVPVIIQALDESTRMRQSLGIANPH